MRNFPVMVTTYLQSLLWKNMNKPLKIDIRNVCEHNIEGPITRTFAVPRKDLISMLEKTDSKNIVDRVEITEFENESRWTVYNPSRVDHPTVSQVKDVANEVTEWDLEPQYGEWSARATTIPKKDAG